MSDEMLTDIRMYSLRIMQDGMVNQSTVTKQEQKLQEIKNEIKESDEDYQTEQLLNLQLCNEHNTIMTDLSHILNKRNSILLECEGLKNTITILYQQLQEMHQSIDEKQQEKETIRMQLSEIEDKLNKWKNAYDTLQNELNELKTNQVLKQNEKQKQYALVCQEKDKCQASKDDCSTIQHQMKEKETQVHTEETKQTQLENQHMEKQQQLTILENTHLKNVETIDKLRQQLAELKQTKKLKHDLYSTKETELTTITKELTGKKQNKQHQMDTLNKNIKDTQLIQLTLHKTIESKQSSRIQYDQQLENHKKQLQDTTSTIDKLYNEIHEIDKYMNCSTLTIQKLQNTINETNKSIPLLNKALKEKQNDLTNQVTLNTKQQNDYKQLQGELNHLLEYNNKLQATLFDIKNLDKKHNLFSQTQCIQQLKEQLAYPL